METCSSCHRAIGDEEMPRVWSGSIVCAGCWDSYDKAQKITSGIKIAPPAARDAPLRIAGKTIAWAFAILACLCTFQGRPGVAVLHYMLLLGIVAETIHACARKWPKRAALIVVGGAVAAIVLLVFYVREDGYNDRWRDKDRTLFLDWYSRWSGALTYRTIFPERTTDGVWIVSMEGPMAGEGGPVPHGMWTTHTEYRKPKFDFKTEYEWFFYGEKVSQAEWHERSRE